jgi:hypothetical protein
MAWGRQQGQGCCRSSSSSTRMSSSLCMLTGAVLPVFTEFGQVLADIRVEHTKFSRQCYNRPPA